MISQNDKTYIFFSAMELTVKRCNEIISHFGCADNVLSALLEGDSFLVDFFNTDYEKFKSKLLSFSFETLEQYFLNKHVGYITIESSLYPQQLKQLDEPPYILYYIGDLSLLSTKNIAIVGSRTPTFYGREITELFAKTLVKNTFQARNYSFPMRNRIIAGLSCGVLLTEAAKKSGSLHTKNFALELGIDVFSVPGNITSTKSEGTNNIIKYGHAQMVTSPNDILEQYGIKPTKVKKEKIELNFDENKIYSILKDGEKSFDEIQYKTNISVQSLNTYLTTMQIRGIIKKLPGNYYTI